MNKKVLKTLEFNKIVEKLADYASSPIGKELCEQTLPLSDINEITKKQKETSDALQRLWSSGPISFSGNRDIRASLKRLQVGSLLSVKELLDISSVLNVTLRAKAFSRGDDIEEDNKDSLSDMFLLLEPLSNLNNEIKRCIISEEEIADDASSTLFSLRKQQKNTSNKIHNQLNSLVNSMRSYLQDGLITMRNGRDCLPVMADRMSMIPGRGHDQSSTGSTLFVEPMSVVNLNNELRELELKEQEEIEKILYTLSDEAATYASNIEENFKLLNELDYIFARAAYSKDLKCSEPVFNTEGIINLKCARHPLLDPKKVVPTNIPLGRDYDLLIITGPNTGGKTVSLKTVGLLTLMGQAGLHIPADEGSALSVFTQVYADIGDEQSIEQNLSTFSSHMKNIIYILEHADKDSLVLFDELCAGTDPVEGAALAISILTFLHNMKIRTMSTTHYSELKVFALSTEGVSNASCEFSLETLSPTYRLLIGIPGKSNAFAISKKLGLPQYIIDDASSHINDESKSFEDIIADLNNSKAEIEKEQAEITSYKAEIEALKAELEKKSENLNDRRESILRSANEEAMEILQAAKEQADKTIKDITHFSKSGNVKGMENSRNALRSKMSDTEKRLVLKGKKLSQKEYKAKDFTLGTAVRVISLGLNGTVSTLPNAKGDLFVQMGILKSQVNIKDLEIIEEEVTKKQSLNKTNQGRIKMSKSLSVSPEINLIGMTTDEAVPILDKYLDDAYLAKLSTVRIVHGRGTGALKNAVHAHLKRQKYVKSYRLGVFGEGDTGVTIVEFK